MNIARRLNVKEENITYNCIFIWCYILVYVMYLFNFLFRVSSDSVKVQTLISHLMALKIEKWQKSNQKMGKRNVIFYITMGKLYRVRYVVFAVSKNCPFSLNFNRQSAQSIYIVYPIHDLEIESLRHKNCQHGLI